MPRQELTYPEPGTALARLHHPGAVLFGPAAVALVLLILAPSIAGAQQQSTFGQAPGEVRTLRQGYVPPTGPAPRLANGKPDFSGIWERPYVPDMANTARDPRTQKGPGPLPYSAAGAENIKNYDPAKNGDYTAMCMPFGLTRSMNSPYPTQIIQSDKHVAILFEQSTWFHVVPFRETHRPNIDPTWFGDSIARWDGDTLVIDTIGFNGYTRLDTRGNPMSDQLHLVQTFRMIDAGHIAYTLTVTDPVNYTGPWTNERTFTLTDDPLIEYSCEENNRPLWEGRLKIWVPPNAEPPRIPPAAAPK